MQAITALLPSKVSTADVEVPEASPQADWRTMYKRRPQGSSTLFELEAMVAKRMEFLAWIDQLVNSPQAANFDAVLNAIAARLPQERRSRPTDRIRQKGTVLGYVDDLSGGTGPRHTAVGGAPVGSVSAHAIIFDPMEDLTSYLLCRFAFCMSDRWRKWFVKTEEVLLRARLKMEMVKDPAGFLVDLMKQNGLPCAPLTEEIFSDPHVQAFIEYRLSRPDAVKDTEGRMENYFTVPLFLATRLIRSRSVLCRGGQAILFRDQVQEVFLTVFRGVANRGLHDAYLARMKEQKFADETEKATVVHMLDVFLEHFISNPQDDLQEGAAGSVRAGDVQHLAQTHFPLCMRVVDTHLRREGHLKHHGRFTYGLFLKAIGLSVEDSMALFASLMSQKGGGSVEAFAKTAYGYNVRHNYGMEGKKTSYSSSSCGTILSLPPVVDKHDCHGCPFRFSDEAAFRRLLQMEQHSPNGKSYPDVRPSAGDIEDIVQDCKGQHFTRACYKYFMVTHPGVRRDTLFRSPYEYYCCSRECEDTAAKDGATLSKYTPGKRTYMTPTANEDVVRRRT